jgi:MYXO-CTERM domain-containing protein
MTRSPFRSLALVALVTVSSTSHAATSDALFVPDANDPNHLHPGPALEKNGFDAAYFSTMARPKLDPAVLARIAADQRALGNTPRRAIAAPVSIPGFTHATLLDGNILVVEGNEGAAQTVNGETSFTHGSGGLETVVSNVWQTLGDEFDFITVFTTFDDEGYAAYYLPLQNDVTGLGNCNLNAGEQFGCTFESFNQSTRLQGFVFMNSIEYWRGFDWNFDGVVHPYTSPDSSLYSTLAQEVAHRWLAALRYKDPLSGATSSKLLGRDGSHWAAYVDTDGSVLDGWDWIDDEQGFKAIDAMNTFWSVDLYAMGAIPSSDVPPFFFIDNARFVPNGYFGNQLIPASAAISVPSPALFEQNNVSVRATGTRVDLGIEDIVAAEGLRCPAPDDAPNAFRQLFVLVTRPNQTKSQVEPVVDQLEQVRVIWEEYFREHTRSQLKICTDVVGDCTLPEAQLGRLALRGTDHLAPGMTAEFDVRALAFDAAVDAADLVIDFEEEAGAHTTIGAGDAFLGTIGANLEFDQTFTLTVDEDCPCGAELRVGATLLSSNAPTKTQAYRLFVGMSDATDWSFDDDDAGFTVVGDGPSAFTREVIRSRCGMSAHGPSDDASPGKGAAFITGTGDETIGETTLTTPAFDLAKGMKLAFAGWVKGDAELRIEVIGDDGVTTLAVLDETTGSRWQLHGISLDGLVDQGLTSAQVRFTALGGAGEVAVDDVRVLAPTGACVAQVNEPDPDETPPVDTAVPMGCPGCSASTPGADGAAFLLMALVLFARRRRSA